MFRSSRDLYLLFLLTLLVPLLVSAPSSAAPCCGGSSLLPSIITADDSAMVSITTTQDAVRDDVLPDGTIYPRADGDSEWTQTLKLSGAYRFLDRFQAGADIPLVRRYLSVSGQSANALGVGDIAFNAAYEVLPEYSYSVWKPKVFLFTRWLLPTGRSIYEATDPLGTDIFGRGFHELSLGTVITKTWGGFDFLVEAEAHWTLARTFVDNTGITTDFHSTWGYSALLAAGYSPGKGAFRIGASLSPVFDASRIFDSAGSIGTTDSQLAWALGLQASYKWSDEWSSTIAYADQTLFGSSHNVTLSKTISLIILRRFPM